MPTEPNYLGQIPFFLEAVLNTPVGSLPKGPLWVIVFEFDENILNTIKSVKQYEPRSPEPWLIDQAVNAVTSSRYQKEKGCMFAQRVTLPGEALGYKQEGLNFNSYIRGGVGGGRTDFNPLRIDFLNTNVNFVENVIRPWVIMTGHLGMIARPDTFKYRCNLTVYKLGIESYEKAPFVSQQYNFYGVCPVSVIASDLSYASDTAITTQAEFVYHWYTTSSTKNKFAKNPTQPTTYEYGAGITVARAVDPSLPAEVRRATIVE
jgi:hypothetical protein